MPTWHRSLIRHCHGKTWNGSGATKTKSYQSSCKFKCPIFSRSFTKLPIILKGILRASDALRGVAAGASAILVSNHGARQLDGVPATIDVLKEIKNAVGEKVEVRRRNILKERKPLYLSLSLSSLSLFLFSHCLTSFLSLTVFFALSTFFPICQMIFSLEIWTSSCAQHARKI